MTVKRQPVGTQTEASEFLDLRQLQLASTMQAAQLQQVRTELQDSRALQAATISHATSSVAGERDEHYRSMLRHLEQTHKTELQSARKGAQANLNNELLKQRELIQRSVLAKFEEETARREQQMEASKNEIEGLKIQVARRTEDLKNLEETHKKLKERLDETTERVYDLQAELANERRMRGEDAQNRDNQGFFVEASELHAAEGQIIELGETIKSHLETIKSLQKEIEAQKARADRAEDDLFRTNDALLLSQNETAREKDEKERAAAEHKRTTEEREAEIAKTLAEAKSEQEMKEGLMNLQSNRQANALKKLAVENSKLLSYFSNLNSLKAEIQGRPPLPNREVEKVAEAPPPAEEPLSLGGGNPLKAAVTVAEEPTPADAKSVRPMSPARSELSDLPGGSGSKRGSTPRGKVRLGGGKMSAAATAAVADKARAKAEAEAEERQRLMEELADAREDAEAWKARADEARRDAAAAAADAQAVRVELQSAQGQLQSALGDAGAAAQQAIAEAKAAAAKAQAEAAAQLDAREAAEASARVAAGKAAGMAADIEAKHAAALVEVQQQQQALAEQQALAQQQAAAVQQQAEALAAQQQAQATAAQQAAAAAASQTADAATQAAAAEAARAAQQAAEALAAQQQAAVDAAAQQQASAAAVAAAEAAALKAQQEVAAQQQAAAAQAAAQQQAAAAQAAAQQQAAAARAAQHELLAAQAAAAQAAAQAAAPPPLMAPPMVPTTSRGMQVGASLDPTPPGTALAPQAPVRMAAPSGAAKAVVAATGYGAPNSAAAAKLAALAAVEEKLAAKIMSTATYSDGLHSETPFGIRQPHSARPALGGSLPLAADGAPNGSLSARPPSRTNARAPVPPPRRPGGANAPRRRADMQKTHELNAMHSGVDALGMNRSWQAMTPEEQKDSRRFSGW